VPRRFGQVARDIFTLADLQFRLFKSDAAQCAERSAGPAIMLGIALVLVLAGAPLLLAALALFLVWLGMPIAGAFALVGVICLAAACGFAIWARTELGNVLSSFLHSREELTRNITWLKEVVERSSRAAREPEEPLRQ
jgi:hypothetical protein